MRRQIGLTWLKLVQCLHRSRHHMELLICTTFKFFFYQPNRLKKKQNRFRRHRPFQNLMKVIEPVTVKKSFNHILCIISGSPKFLKPNMNLGTGAPLGQEPAPQVAICTEQGAILSRLHSQWQASHCLKEVNAPMGI
jgi:hypothetical protein